MRQDVLEGQQVRLQFLEELEFGFLLIEDFLTFLRVCSAEHVTGHFGKPHDGDPVIMVDLHGLQVPEQVQEHRLGGLSARHIHQLAETAKFVQIKSRKVAVMNFI